MSSNIKETSHTGLRKQMVKFMLNIVQYSFIFQFTLERLCRVYIHCYPSRECFNISDKFQQNEGKLNLYYIQSTHVSLEYAIALVKSL